MNRFTILSLSMTLLLAANIEVHADDFICLSCPEPSEFSIACEDDACEAQTENWRGRAAEKPLKIEALKEPNVNSLGDPVCTYERGGSSKYHIFIARYTKGGFLHCDIIPEKCGTGKITCFPG